MLSNRKQNRAQGRFGGLLRGALGWALLLEPVGSLAQSARSGIGAIPYSGGTTFRVWAPNATGIKVAGGFNSWTGVPLISESNGFWSLDVAGAVVGQEFKYIVNGSTWKRDPRSRKVTNSNGNSIIYDPTAFNWQGYTNYPILNLYHNGLVLYEMHVGAFYAPNGYRGSFDDAIKKIPHLKNLGINAVSLMPINEFPGDYSWGYNPSDIFAVENAGYGGPDAFKRFVLACHSNNIAVLVDIVHNHYGPSDLGGSLWQFDGWSQNGKGGIYFYNSSGYCCTPWGDRPDYSRQQVRDFISDQIRMWLNEYQVDGFRWDAVHFIRNYGDLFGPYTYIPDGASLLTSINSMMGTNYPGKIRIAEADNTDNGFDSHWEQGFHNDLLYQLTLASDAGRSMSTVAGLIGSWKSFGRVIYLESHDTVGAQNSKHRLPRDIDSSDPTSIWARKRSLLGAGIMLTSPGMPMLFQGQEMLEDWDFSDSTPLRWDRTNTYAGITRAYSTLVRARRNLDGHLDGLKGSETAFYKMDEGNKVLAYHRYPWNSHGENIDVFVIANFSNTSWTNDTYEFDFPYAGSWTVRFNSDATAYGADFDGIGPSVVTASGSPPRATVNMGRYSLMILSRGGDAPVGSATFDPPQPTGCNPVVVTYDPGDGPLKNAAQVTAHIGRNRWQDVRDEAMALQGSVWVYTNATLPGTYQLDVVFHEGDTWDNNNDLNWQVGVSACPSADNRPLVLITNPADNVTVPYPVSTYTLKGVCSSGTVGHLQWSNQLTGASGSLPAGGSWTMADIALQVGTNRISVSGTNDAVWTSAADTASNAVYSAGWTNGSNGGTGWESGWALSGSANAGHYRPVTEANLEIGPYAWGMWANSGALSESIRHLAYPLASGDVFQVQFDNNWVNGGGQVGIGLRNNWDTNLFEFFFIGGQTNYQVRDGRGTHDIPLTWTNIGLHLSLQLTTRTTYQFAVQYATNTVIVTGQLASASDQQITRFRAWNSTAGGGTDYNLYLNNLLINGRLIPAVSTGDWVLVVREAGDDQTDTDHDQLPDWWEIHYFFGPTNADANTDTDHDGFINLHELLLGTKPTDSNSTFRISETERSSINFPVITWTSVGGKSYAVEYSENILRGFTTAVIQAETNVPIGMETTISYTDSGVHPGGPFTNQLRAYRIRLIEP